jgi:hypothetical protein
VVKKLGIYSGERKIKTQNNNLKGLAMEWFRVVDLGSIALCGKNQRTVLYKFLADASLKQVGKTV